MMKKIILLLSICMLLGYGVIQAQIWTQIGSDIEGEAAVDYSGYSVSLSSDGSIIAIGAPFNDGNGNAAGHVRIFENMSGMWTQIGNDIDGVAEGDGFGTSVSLNSDGTILAAGAPTHDELASNFGHVRIFQNISGTWTQLGSDINGEAALDESGTSVSLNSDGTIVAIGSPCNASPDYHSGQVRIYEYSGGNWVQTGNDLNGGSVNDEFGTSVSLSSDGTIVAVGAPVRADYYTGDRIGYANVYENVGGVWTLIGDTIKGEADADRSGISVSLSSDGSIVAIGAAGNDGNGNMSGHVRVFENIGGTWTQIGDDIDGEAAIDYSGGSVSLNSDGSIVAIGAYGNDDNGDQSGHVRIFQNISGTWTQVGSDIDGIAKNDYSGVVSLSSDGLIVADGANRYDGTNGDDEGHVRIYELLTLPGITTQPIDQSDICPGSNTSFSIAGDNIDNYQWQESTDNASTFNDITNGGVYSNATTATLNITGVTGVMHNYQYRCILANGDGNAISDTVSLTIETESPVISSTHNDQALTADANCEASLPDYRDDVVAIDNCDVSLEVAQSPVAGTTISGSTNQVTLTVTDDAGNIAEALFNVEVEDNTDPEITSIHDDQTIDANSSCQASLPDYTSSVTAIDNCDANLEVIQFPVAGTIISGFINEVTLTVSDDDGNTAEVSFNVAVEDKTDPEITSTHDDQTVDANSNCQVSLPDYTSSVTATDNCDASLEVTQTPVAGTLISGSINEVTLTVSDDAGNNADVSFNVAVEDNTDPVITSTHNDQTLDASTNCEVSIPDYTSSVNATDNCDTDLEVIQSPVAGTLISGSTNQVTLTVSDDAGNTADVSFNVTIEDNSEPVIISTHNDQIVDVDSDCQANLPDYTLSVIATDNCDTDLEITQTPVTGTLILGSTNQVTLTITDDDGNIAEVSFNVAVEDNTDPVITSTHNNQVLNDDSNCQASLPDYTESLTATDNCDASLEVTQSPVAGTLISGSANQVTLTVTDNAGNTAEVSFNVAIEDNTDPVITSTHDDKIVDANTNCQASLLDYTVNLTATDNCDTDLEVTQSPVVGTIISGSTNLVTLTVSDGTGNTDDISFNVAVEDNTDPTIACVGNQEADADATNTYTISGNEFDLTSSNDNCEISSITNDFNNSETLAGTQLPVGTTTITWIVTDVTGNYTECSFDVLINAYVGIKVLKEIGVSIYPNPTNGIIGFNLGDNNIQKISILDIIGNTIIEKTSLQQNETINLSGFSSGLYIIILETDKGIFSTKIIKE